MRLGSDQIQAIRWKSLDSAAKRNAVVEKAIAFVLSQWGEMQELKDTNSLSIPVEYMNLHHAVCSHKHWEPFGDFPIQEGQVIPKR